MRVSAAETRWALRSGMKTLRLVFGVLFLTGAWG